MKEILTQHKALSDDVACIQRYIAALEEKKGKHERRIDEHEAETGEAEKKLAEVVENLARDKATEKDLDRALATLESLKSKGSSLSQVLVVFDKDIEANRQLRETKEKELARVFHKISSIALEDLLVTVLGPLWDLYAAYRYSSKRNKIVVPLGFEQYIASIAPQLRKGGLQEKDVLPRGEEIFSKFLK